MQNAMKESAHALNSIVAILIVAAVRNVYLTMIALKTEHVHATNASTLVSALVDNRPYVTFTTTYQCAIVQKE